MTTTAEQIKTLKKEKNAVILAHTYQPAEVQDVADYVGDSYGLSVEAMSVRAGTIIFCGVKFMAETAAILNPDKTVILAEKDAGCPMADMITPADLRGLRKEYPDYVVLCYVNSAAEIKALSDICCTSSNAVKIAQKIPAKRGIIFVPDQHLGSWVQEKTGRTMVMWNGCCPTHVRIKPAMIAEARASHPRALVLMHPEAPREVRGLADQILSTGGMLSFAAKDPHKEFIIATEMGVVHTLAKRNPAKKFFAISEHITCPNMRKGSLKGVLAALEGTGGLKVSVAEDIATKSEGALRRMLEMSGQE